MSEQTYRNPLFGRRVDRYIPPELRQGIGALLAGADMLNPVSAYREYLKDVREGDVVGGVTNAAGFVAPGVASAFASRLARPAVSAVAPYADDAARVLMEVLSPTGAPDVSAAGRNAPRGMSRREFLAGLGAAAATPALPVDEMLEGLGRAGARGGGRLGAGLSGLRNLRDSILSVNDLTSSDEGMIYTLNREISDLRGGYFDNELVPREVTERISSLESELSALSDKLSGPRAQRQDLIGNYSSARDDLFGDVVANTDDFISEIGDLSDDDLSELGSQLAQYVANPSNVSRLKSGGYEPSEIVSSFGRISGRLREEAVRRDLGGKVLDDVEYLLSDGLPELEYLYRLEGSQPRYSADFGSMLPDVTSRMVGGGDEFGRGLGSSGETVSSIPAREGIRAYHGSPHTFERFDMSKIGTGEGAQAYGRGLYFAESEGVARSYRDALSSTLNNWSVDGVPAGRLQSLDPLKMELAQAVRSGRDVSDAIDYLVSQYRGKMTSRREMIETPENIPVYKEAIDRLNAMRENPPVIENNPGRMYEVRIDADPEDFLDWDKPLSEQPQVARAFGYAPPEEIAAMKDEVRAGLARIAPDGDLSRFFDNPTPEFERLRQLDSEARRLSDWTGMTGQDLGFRLFQDPVHSATNVKDAARSGIPGIRYLDAGSRGAGDGSRNYVVFDDRLISIVRMYGIGGAAALLGVSALDVEQALANNLSQGELEGLLSGPQSRPD